MAIQKIQSSNARDHAKNVAHHLAELKDHCRDDVDDISDPRGKALFETVAEVLGGLEKAMTRYQSENT